eukprot:TRINITY_DN18142_c0_g1_i1.p1 TRINITY_DN18142_c0_g1~~TRINITY_DN18142_c0_g1_i1.p1  ORF type:complete len:562 (+),score=151.02 TRINITY_DN18142_c0_g1_i1:180-1688(+)
MIPDPDTSVYLGDGLSSNSLITADQLADVSWGKEYNEQVIPPKVVKPPPTGDEEDAPPAEEEAPAEDKGELADVVEEHLLFNMVGIGLGESEAYRLMVSMKRLLDKEPLKSAKFFGRIFTLSNYYYIAETEVDPDRQPEAEEGSPPEEEEGAGKPPSTILGILQNGKTKTEPQLPAEAAGQPGANKFRYYVTTDFCSWRALPDVKPCHIQAARLIKKLFTGNLSAPIQCHPPFPGSEAEYLRAQIARISFGCKVAPKGMFKPPEEEEDEDAPKKESNKRPPYETVPELTPVEDVPEEDDTEAWANETLATWARGYEHDALMNISNWVHIEPEILKSQGRTTEHKFTSEDEEEAEADTPPPGPIEEIHSICSGADEDDSLNFPMHWHSKNCSWTVRKAATQPSVKAMQVYLLKSLRWPGAVCYASVHSTKPGSQFCNVYIGDGLKSDAVSTFSPPTPNVERSQPIKKAILQTDFTADDEAEFSPPPPPPVVDKQEEEEEEEDE